MQVNNRGFDLIHISCTWELQCAFGRAAWYWPGLRNEGHGQVYNVGPKQGAYIVVEVLTLLPRFVLFEPQRNYLRVQELFVFVVFTSYKIPWPESIGQLLHVLNSTLYACWIFVSGVLQACTFLCPQVHRACAERQILEILDHPFLPTLYASFQVSSLMPLFRNLTIRKLVLITWKMSCMLDITCY